MTEDRELSAMLRDGLAAEARQVSASAALTERMIRASTASAADRDEYRPRAWQAWVLPAAAAVLVALLASSVLIGGKLLHSAGNHPASSVGPLPLPTTSAPTSPPSSTPKPTVSSSVTSSPTQVPVGPVGGPVPAGFRAVDLTWISPDEGWALGTAPCATAPCTSIVRTTDGGKSWVGIHAPAAELFGLNNCQGNCISQLRFANSMVGYAYGLSALYLTTDGGDSWVRQDGQAAALEIGDGTVLRVTSQDGCPPGCTYRLQRAMIGSSSWQTVQLPAGGQGTRVQLVRNGHLAVLATYANFAGGAEHTATPLFVSTNDGVSWTSRGEVCPQTGGTEVDTRAVAVAPDGSISVLCTTRGGTDAQFTMTSTDGGGHFTAAPSSLGAAPGDLLGAASASQLFVSLDELYRSTDGGKHWQRTRSQGPDTASYIGFETPTVGRVLGLPANGTMGTPTVWTTTDAGQSWTAYTFH